MCFLWCIVIVVGVVNDKIQHVCSSHAEKDCPICYYFDIECVTFSKILIADLILPFTFM